MCSMLHRTGAELFVRDIALTLHQRGHSITVYAPFMGDMVEELQARCIACVTELRQVAQAPEIIIGNTRDETVAAMAQFLDVPVISICHDRTAPHGRPPQFTRIRQHIAVDENCAERLYLENGIERSAVKIVSNGVDVHRFRKRPPLPEKPLKAAIFSNYSTEHQHTSAIRCACNELGISLDVIGSGVGRQDKSPELTLAHYDLVFAKARCAMEAMAVGSAVILYNEGMGLAGMVNSRKIEEWHRWNFGRRLLQKPVQMSSVIEAIQQYDAVDADSVSSYVREHISLEATVDALERIAYQVLHDEAALPKSHPAMEIREFSRFLMESQHPLGSPQTAVQLGIQHEKIAALNEVIGQLQQQIRLQHQLEEQRQEQEVLQQQQQRQGQEVRDARLAELQQELHLANELVSGLKQEVLALRNSRSWRLTAPVRWLASKFSI